MKITNPTKVDVTVNYKGQDYTVEAGKSETFPAEVVEHWISVHGFMVASADDVKEVKEEKPKKVATKKVTKKEDKK